MDFWQVLSQLLILLATALVLGAFFERLKQSAILGFLLAGTLIGPGGLDLVNDPQVLQTVAELGVALLLFVIGLEFSLKRLLRLGMIGIGGGTVQVVATLLGGALLIMGLKAALPNVPWLASLTWPAAMAIGAMGALSSTACVLRVLADRSALESVYGRASLGVLLLQDLAVVPLVLLISMLRDGGGAGQMAIGLLRAVLMIAAMLVGFYLFSNFVLPRILQSSVAKRNRELLILLATLVALGSAWLSHHFGLSPALGAFLAGMMLAESPFALQIRSDVGSLRALFVTLFFVSIGMFGDPEWILANWVEVSLAVAVVVLGKAVLISLIARGFGLGWRPAIAAGICLAQVGEFSFVIAKVASESPASDGTAMIDDHLFRLVVSATLVTLFLTPYLVAIAPQLSRVLAVAILRSKLGDRQPSQQPHCESPRGHCIVVGYGPAGQAVAVAVQQRQVPLIIMDSNPANIRKAQHDGYATVLADATGAEIWRHLHVESAEAVVVTVPDHHSAAQVIHQVRGHMPYVPIIARSRYHVFVEDLAAAGAEMVVDEEVLIGRELAGLVGGVLKPGEPTAGLTDVDLPAREG